jgi:hypothetical protein
MRKRLVFWTVLNALDHPRVVQKQARTLAQAGFDVRVHAQALPDGRTGAFVNSDGLTLCPMPRFGRSSFQRLVVGVRLLWRLPARTDVLVVHAPELLPFAWVARLWHHCAVVYDVHEDFATDWQHRPGLHPWLAQAATRSIRWLEHWCRPWLAGAVYAEACYADRLGLGAAAVVIRNTVPPPVPPPTEPVDFIRTSGELLWVHTGTLSPGWGIHEAVELTLAFNQLASHTGLRARLWLVGGTADTAQLQAFEHWLDERLPSESHSCPVISVVPEGCTVRSWGAVRCLRPSQGGTLPHALIQAAQRQADAILALYRPTPSVQHKVPTKFYEAAALGKPLIFTALPAWLALNQAHGLGIALDPHLTPDAQAAHLAHAWPHRPQPPINPAFWSWEPEADRLVAFYRRLASE